MPRYRIEIVTHNDEEFHVGISELGAPQNSTADLLISFGSDVSGDKVKLQINGAPFRVINARIKNLSDLETRLVEFALEEAPMELTPGLAQRAIAKLREMFSLERPFVDEASTKKLPEELQHMLSKQTMISKLQHDPMFYNNINSKARANPKHAMVAISQVGELLDDAPANIKNNKAIVIAAIKTFDDGVYANASDELKGDWDVICCLAAFDVDHLSYAYRFKPELFNDTNFIVYLLNGVHRELAHYCEPLLAQEFAMRRESTVISALLCVNFFFVLGPLFELF